MRAHAVLPPGEDLPAKRLRPEPGQLSTWPDGKTITESNRVPGTWAKYPPNARLAAARYRTVVVYISGYYAQCAGRD
jgi:hypothetical protein